MKRNNKTFAQKAYEKLEMVKRNPDKLRVMIAEDGDGMKAVVLMVKDTPVALILKEPNGLYPNFEKSEILHQAFEVASAVDMRKHPDEFAEDNMLVSGIIEDGLSEMEI
jgi:hypothetical protein